jgi:DNA-binding LacI/PurR family transcriptional regulator
MAIGAMRVLSSQGVRVPWDASVAGIGNASVAAMVASALTTAARDFDVPSRRGRRAERERGLHEQREG